MKVVLRFCISLLFLSMSLQMISQDDINKDSSQQQKSFVAAYPIVFYFPETRLGFGAAGIKTFNLDDTSSEYNRPSNISIGLAYTLEKQILIYNFYKIYFNDNKSRLFGEIDYFKYFYFFYGLGEESNLEDEETYDVTFPRIRINYLHKIRKNTFVGLRYHFDNYNITRTLSNGIIETQQLTGYLGGLTSGFGLVMQYDSRDNVFLPYKGVFATIVIHSNTSITASDFEYIQWSAQVDYFKIIAKKSSIALDFFVGGSSANIPFQELWIIGGGIVGRGYTNGRFRARYLNYLQLEYRFPIVGKFSGVGFAGTYRVDMKKLSSFINDPVYNYGFGLRYMLDEKDRLNLRLDFGFTDEASNFYFTIGEAF